jgi:serine/threonine protein kinase
VRELEPYRVLRRLAVGGMAEVLLAERDGRLVAVKRVLPHLMSVAAVVTRLEEEAALLAVLDHPAIVQAVDFAQIGGGAALVLEHVAGTDVRTLARRARASGVAFPESAAAAVLAAVAGALAFAHAQGVAHRDVKASNLLVAFDGAVKLADFGIAQRGGRRGADVRALVALGRRLAPAGGALASALAAPPRRAAELEAALVPLAAGGREALVELLTRLVPRAERERGLHDDDPADATLPLRRPRRSLLSVGALALIGAWLSWGGWSLADLRRGGAPPTAFAAAPFLEPALLPAPPAPPALQLPDGPPISDNGSDVRASAAHQ